MKGTKTSKKRTTKTPPAEAEKDPQGKQRKRGSDLRRSVGAQERDSWLKFGEINNALSEEARKCLLEDLPPQSSEMLIKLADQISQKVPPVEVAKRLIIRVRLVVKAEKIWQAIGATIKRSLRPNEVQSFQLLRKAMRPLNFIPQELNEKAYNLSTNGIISDPMYLFIQLAAKIPNLKSVLGLLKRVSGRRVLVFEVKGVLAATQWLDGFTIFHKAVTEESPRLIEFGPSQDSQCRLYRLLKHSISPSCSFHNILSAIVYDPQQIFCYAKHLTKERLARRPKLIQCSGIWDEAFSGGIHYDPQYIDFGMSDALEKEVKEKKPEPADERGPLERCELLGRSGDRSLSFFMLSG